MSNNIDGKATKIDVGTIVYKKVVVEHKKKRCQWGCCVVDEYLYAVAKLEVLEGGFIPFRLCWNDASINNNKKGRVAKVKVLSITDDNGSAVETAFSHWSPSFVYKVDAEIVPHEFESDEFAICAPGIHCYLLEADAWAHNF